MSKRMEEDIKCWTAKHKSALVLDIIQSKTTVLEASRQYDLSLPEVEQWVSDRLPYQGIGWHLPRSGKACTADHVLDSVGQWLCYLPLAATLCWYAAMAWLRVHHTAPP